MICMVWKVIFGFPAWNVVFERIKLLYSEIAQVICASTADLLYVKRRARILLDDLAADENLSIRVTTIDKVRTNGVAAMFWEEV
jgi:hypothetical protein